MRKQGMISSQEGCLLNNKRELRLPFFCLIQMRPVFTPATPRELYNILVFYSHSLGVTVRMQYK